MFLHLSVSHSVHSGEGVSASVHAGIHLQAGTPPVGTPPGRYTPQAGTPPGQVPPRQVHPLASTPLWAGTPPPPRQSLQ